MSARSVYEKMKSHYLATGEVMRNELFVSQIASKFKTEHVIEGLMIFNQFLDEKRKGVS
ncbi:hypothetical protein [Bacillus sp. 03113]|uniref:hypothetical protein n=1 Tax=Bacillus sp. 03113 TaxID=2578211 RepID=UPI0015E8BB7D|nr:hypothetical protein [Bacillus sp. 03113]